MKHYVWATYLVRVLGLLTVLVSVPALFTTVYVLFSGLWELLVGPPGTVTRWMNDFGMIQSMWPIATMSIGLYLFLGGNWVVRRLTRGLPGACAYCGYSLKGAQTSICPECGTRLEQSPQG